MSIVGPMQTRARWPLGMIKVFSGEFDGAVTSQSVFGSVMSMSRKNSARALHDGVSRLEELEVHGFVVVVFPEVVAQPGRAGGGGAPSRPAHPAR